MPPDAAIRAGYASFVAREVKRRWRILLADDEEGFRRAAKEILEEGETFAVEEAADGESAWRSFCRQPADLVLADIRMPGMDGLTLLARIREAAPAVPVVIITAHGALDSAIEALRRGARDYILKPCDLEELRIRIERLLAERELARKAEALARDSRDADFSAIVGSSEAMRKVLALVEKVARTPSTVLVTGESGTGKELVAREIHRRSGRDRFVPVNCGAIPENLLESELFGHVKGAFTGASSSKEGLFRLADGGTLFLDEIGELPPSLQVKLLRALDTGEIQPVGAPGPVHCAPRVVAATNRNLAEEVEAGRFREDLYYRLHVFEIAIPPLRERREDIPSLAQHFVERFARRAGKPIHGIEPAALRALCAAPWRGNVRELENVLERAVILAEGETIALDDLPESFRDPGASEFPEENLREALARFEREHIARVLAACGGDKREAARRLGIGLSSLYRKLEEKEAVR